MRMSELLLLPFRVLRPPILETPFRTISLPTTKVTVPLLLLSILVITSGAVFCTVTNAPFFAIQWDAYGRADITLVMQNQLSRQCIAEGILFGITVVLGGLSAIAAFVAITSKGKWRRTIAFAYVVRLAYTVPVWALLMFEIIVVKLPWYTVSFTV